MSSDVVGGLGQFAGGVTSLSDIWIPDAYTNISLNSTTLNVGSILSYKEITGCLEVRTI